MGDIENSTPEREPLEPEQEDKYILKHTLTKKEMDKYVTVRKGDVPETENYYVLDFGVFFKKTT